MDRIQKILLRLKEALRERVEADRAFAAFEQEGIRREAARAKKAAQVLEAEAKYEAAVVEEMEANCAEISSAAFNSALSDRRRKATKKREELFVVVEKLQREHHFMPWRDYDGKARNRQHEATKAWSAVQREMRAAMRAETEKVS